VTVVPYYRIQTVIDSRTIFQRRWNVATIVADTAGGSSLSGTSAAAVDFELDEAIELRETLQDRLQSALTSHRDRRDRFEWFEGDVDEAVEAEPDVRDDDDAGVADPDITDAEDVDAPRDAAETPSDADAAETPSDADAAEIPDADRDAEHTDAGDDETSPEIPDDGVIRPDFDTSERDYSEPAERIDTGEYAVDRFPSDADVAHRGSDREETADDEETGEESADDREAASDDESASEKE
jgi:putative membrane protein